MIKHMMFDLDGTLIDSFPSIIKSYKYAVKTVYGNENVSEEFIKNLIGLSFDKFFLDYPECDREKLESLFKTENDFLQKNGVDFFAGTKEALYKIKEKGIVVSLVTGKRKTAVMHWVKAMQVEDLFDHIVAREDVVRGKPSGDLIEFCIRKEKISPEECIYVGDSEYDILCAHNAGIKCAVVSWTSIDIERLDKHNPDVWINSADDIIKVVS